MIIKQPVGVKATNAMEDVAVVQELINDALSKKKLAHSTLIVDGLFGPATNAAIQHVQERIVKLERPDGVVDPDGVTIRVMRKLVSPPDGAADTTPGKANKERTVKLRKNAYPAISQYTESILRFAMELADVHELDVSSTLRTISDQARIMFDDNEAARRAGKTVREHRGYGYGPVGQAVDRIYLDNVGKITDEEIRRKMEEEIRCSLKLGKRTSRHCVEDSAYRHNNILDVPYSGIRPRDRRDEFEAVLISLANSFNKRKYSDESVEIEGIDAHPRLRLIDKVIVERSCWHLEIPQDGKEIPELRA
uniref:Peptidoglycan binding domain-containing protein n=1 Tax=Candidatus Kentrum sp. FW TaxID=2126338 RepID=A0A450TV16_9GAMM|nr:MAG: hypothetical protein BECKFW1821C_GA0114237_10383 [Candidatus Kentron sp. FW]